MSGRARHRCLLLPVKKYIGAYLAVLGGVDAVVFTGGIGENAVNVRARILGGMERLGIVLDRRRNSFVMKREAEVGAAESAVRILVIPTNEEAAIASDTYTLISERGSQIGQPAATSTGTRRVSRRRRRPRARRTRLLASRRRRRYDDPFAGKCVDAPKDVYRRGRGVRGGRARDPRGRGRRAEARFPAAARPHPRPGRSGRVAGVSRTLAAWRDARRRQSWSTRTRLYRRPDFAWVDVVLLVLFPDAVRRDLLRPARRGRYTVGRFPRPRRREFGGYDASSSGTPTRGSAWTTATSSTSTATCRAACAGLREVVDALHARGVRVFIDYNPWDTGTRREGKSDLDALVELVRALDADGIFLDTMDRGAAEFRAKLDAARPGVVLEGEGALPLERVHDHHCPGRSGSTTAAVPGVLRNKWLERRHLQHQIQPLGPRPHGRTAHGLDERQRHDGLGERVRLLGRLERARPLVSPRHAPHPAALLRDLRGRRLDAAGSRRRQPGVYASLWEGEGLRLWTLVNRSEQAVRRRAARGADAVPGERLFDLVAGRELRPAPRAAVRRRPASIRPAGDRLLLAAAAGGAGRRLRRVSGRPGAPRSGRADGDTSPRGARRASTRGRAATRRGRSVAGRHGRGIPAGRAVR